MTWRRALFQGGIDTVKSHPQPPPKIQYIKHFHNNMLIFISLLFNHE